VAYSAINALTIIEELTTPNSNLAGRLLIECSKGELDVVKDLVSKMEEIDQKLPLQPMLVTALAFKHIDVAKFCIEKGAPINADVEVAVWSSMSLEILKLTFPLDIFRWSQHREFLDNLLFDCFSTGMGHSEVQSLAEFLFEHGAKVQWNVAKLVATRWPALMPFLLSHISDEECKDGVLVAAINEFITYHPQDTAQIDILLSRSAGASIPDSLLRPAVRHSAELVKLLQAHGIRPTDPRLVHEAALSGHQDVVSLLLDHGLLVNHCDTKGWFGVYSRDDPPFPNYGYALHYAVYRAQPDAVGVLLERGADPNLRGKAGADAFEVPVGWSSDPEERRSEVKRLLGLVRGVAVGDIPEIIRRDRARARAREEL
jgi:hypothetical protein